jgi:DNA-binding transcriptional MerR regulator
MSTLGTMRIGEVHAILRRDVPDIELSKIRYYEDKGLVQPTRSRKGYRLYSQRDVECLREAIRLAHEEFVPLRVVRLRLIEQGLLDDTPLAAGSRQVARATSNVISVAVPVAESVDEPVIEPVIEPVVEPIEHGDVASPKPESHDDALVAESGEEADVASDAPDETAPEVVPSPVVAREATASVTPVPDATAKRRAPAGFATRDVDEFDEWEQKASIYSHAEFLAVSGLDANVLHQLVASGLLCPEVVAHQSTFNELDVRVARAVKVLLARNVDIRLLGSLRRNVEREIGLLSGVIQPVRLSKRALSAREAHDTAKSVALELAALRAELFARALRQYLGR